MGMLQWRSLVPAFLILSALSGGSCAGTQTPVKRVPFPNHVDRYNDTLMWAVELDLDEDNPSEAAAIATQVAADCDLENRGQIGHLKNSYLFVLKTSFSANNRNPDVKQSTVDNVDSKKSFAKQNLNEIQTSHISEYGEDGVTEKAAKIEEKLEKHTKVLSYSHQKIRTRQKREIAFEDPFYPQQWHLKNFFDSSMDVNVTGVWETGVTGKGITVAVVDDGLEWDNPDLRDNYSKEGSWDLNDDDSDPMPAPNKETNHHGTRCAGEISAVPNTVCAVGVAYGAKVSGLRILDGPMTDSLEASAFTKNCQTNDIYSCSWGPDDDGKTVDGPHSLASAAMKYGIDFGRHGYGNIYVVASGNGGQAGDNCNYDGYANSIYTVTIGAVGETGHMPYYSEECASMLAVTFSSGGPGTRDIVTTDWTHRMNSEATGCTEHHTGTSAAAPIAAGLVALMLQVQPCLTWRDVQYIIILTAQKVDIDVAHWQKNGAGLWHSHKHGFGLMKAWRLVNAAQVWDMVPWLTMFNHVEDDLNIEITKGKKNPLILTHTVTADNANGYDLYLLETVQVTLTINHPRRGNLDIRLISPHGTKSVIGASRPHDNSSAGFDKWTFSTVRCWGEAPVGEWTIIITDKDQSRYAPGHVKYMELKLYGTPMSAGQLQHRRGLIEEAMHGGYLNVSKARECPPPPVTSPPDVPMSQKTLKILTLISAFSIVMAVYETLEYLLCYNEEKEEQTKMKTMLERAYRLAGTVIHPNSNERQQSRTGERSGLLMQEEIPMQTFPPSSSAMGQRDSSNSETSFNPTGSRHGSGPSDMSSNHDNSSRLPGTSRPNNGEGVDPHTNPPDSTLPHSANQSGVKTHHKSSKQVKRFWDSSGYTLLPSSSDEEVEFEREGQRSRSERSITVVNACNGSVRGAEQSNMATPLLHDDTHNEGI